jgi:hypothetical protein
MSYSFIAVVALILSALPYQNFTNISDRIINIASEEIRSNALIQINAREHDH